jgi:ribose transport system permease protein
MPTVFTTSPDELHSNDDVASATRRLLSGNGWAIWLATVLLFAGSPLVAAGSLDSAPILSMIPFASVLAVVAAGQTLVVQQRGLDLSVPGMIALGAALVTGLPQNHGWSLWPAALLAVLACGLAGAVNGVIITGLRVMPLVATLGVNALLLGVVFSFTNGTPAGAPDALNQFALRKTVGIPNTLLVALVVILVAAVVTQRSIIGRRLTAAGVSERAARALGIRVNLYQVTAYAFAGLCYGAGGVLLAGYTKTPPLFLGDGYLLPSVAAVVLGGTALTGGMASVLNTGVAALFLTQLGQLLRALGWTDATQLIAQSIVLLVVVVAREVLPALYGAWSRRRGALRPPLPA